MQNKSLEKQAIITFAIFLLFAMSGVSCVWVMFLQRQMVKGEIETAKHEITYIYRYLARAVLTETDFSKEEIVAILSGSEAECYRIQLRQAILEGGRTQGCFSETQHENLSFSGSSERDFNLIFSGSIWSVFTLSHRAVRVDKVLKDRENRIVGKITLQVSLAKVYKELREKSKIVASYAVAIALILVTLYYIRLRTILFKPIEKLIEKADAYTPDAGIFLGPSLVTNEFGQLSLSLKRMSRRIQDDKNRLQSLVNELQISNSELEKNKEEIVRVEKLASVGKLAAGLAHEIGNPLGIIQGYVDLLANDDLANGERQQFASRADKELQRINGLIRQLLDFSRTSNQFDLKRVDVVEVLSETVAMVRAQKISGKTTFQQDFETSSQEVLADGDQLRQVFLNCLLNALEAVLSRTEDDRKIMVKCEKIRDELLGDIVKVRITDNGPGLTEEAQSHAFVPFYTTREPGKGTGLGLYVSHMIVDRLGGKMIISNNEEGGAEVEIILPAFREI